MMPQDMPQDDDKAQDMDMISQVLRKVADEMDKMDADGYLPDHMKPKMVEAKVEASPLDDMPMDDDSDESDDASMLPSLMDKAGMADDEGALPEDKQDDVDPAIAAIVAQKKKELPQ